MKSKIEMFVIGLVIACMLLTTFPMKVTQAIGIPGQGNYSPHADAGGPYYGTTQAAVEVDGSSSYDPDGTVVGWCWDWTGDGTWDTGWLNVSTASHQYTTPGAYTLKLKVKDNLGGQSAIDSTTVFVNGVNSIAISLDTYPWFIRKNHPITPTIIVQNLQGPGLYWYNIELSIWDDLEAQDPYSYPNPATIHFETTNNPLIAPYTQNYTTEWISAIPGDYWLKGVLDCGSDTAEHTEWFHVLAFGE
jgi:hypothetical protein